MIMAVLHLVGIRNVSLICRLVVSIFIVTVLRWYGSRRALWDLKMTGLVLFLRIRVFLAAI